MMHDVYAKRHIFIYRRTYKSNFVNIVIENFIE